MVILTTWQEKRDFDAICNNSSTKLSPEFVDNNQVSIEWMIWCCFSHKSLQICVLTGGVPPFPLTINIQPSRPGICRSPVHVAPYIYDLNYFDLNYLSCRLNQRFGALNDFGFSHQGDMTGNGRHVRNGAVTRHLQAACLCLKCRNSGHFHRQSHFQFLPETRRRNWLQI